MLISLTVAILTALIVLAVLYNQYQERRARQAQMERFLEACQSRVTDHRIEEVSGEIIVGISSALFEGFFESLNKGMKDAIARKDQERNSR